MKRKRHWLVPAVALVSLAIPGSTKAAIEIGRADGPGLSPLCSGPSTFIQSNTGANTPSYSVPAGGGVIVAWRVEAFKVDEILKLKVVRPTPLTNVFTVVGESDTFGFPGPGIQEFPAQIPVDEGDRIGFTTGSAGFSGCIAATSDPADIRRVVVGDPAVGSTVTTSGPSLMSTLNLAATVEPDCDGDGAGDETQDQDLSFCPPGPTATITSGPKDKVKTKKARAKVTFAFTASEPGATFDCALDDKQEFKACTSPTKLKVKKGEHSFSVQATDPGGNVGAAASDTWKVKKTK